jgi:hypothetical protein
LRFNGRQLNLVNGRFYDKGDFKMKIPRCCTALMCVLAIALCAEAHSSKAWKEHLAARTTTLWIDGQTLGENIVLNARGQIAVTWVERGLLRRLSEDTDVEEWLVASLSYYSSNRKETRAKVKKRDIFVLNYKALKNWNFTPTHLVVGGYAVTSDDILTKKDYWETELAAGETGTVAVAAPPLKPGQKVEIRYEDADATFEAPRK